MQACMRFPGGVDWEACLCTRHTREVCATRGVLLTVALPGPFTSAAILCRYFDQPSEVKAKYPSVDWGAVKLLGYEVNRMHEGGM